MHTFWVLKPGYLSPGEWRPFPLWPVFFFLKEYPSVALENKERIDAIRKADEEIHANFWRIQGSILGSIAD